MRGVCFLSAKAEENCEDFYLAGVRSFNSEGGARVRKKILRVWSGLVCDQEGKNEIVKMSRRNRQRDLTMDSSGHIAMQVLDVIYLFS